MSDRLFPLGHGVLFFYNESDAKLKKKSIQLEWAEHHVKYGVWKLENFPHLSKPSYRWYNNRNRAEGAGEIVKNRVFGGGTKDMDTPPRGGGVSAEINGNKNISRKLTEIRVYG